MEHKIHNVVVLKVGTSTITNEQNQLDIASFNRIGGQVHDLVAAGNHVAIVSSGAIAAGIGTTKSRSRSEYDYSVTELGQFAGIGWRYVLNGWSDSLKGLELGELLLTHADLRRRSERAKALAVTHCLLKNGRVAIVNENDAVSHQEITFGDNDKLAARLAAKMARSSLFGRDIKLVILSDVDGVYKDIHDKSIDCIGNQQSR